jgi:hypothetical protein
MASEAQNKQQLSPSNLSQIRLDSDSGVWNMASSREQLHGENDSGVATPIRGALTPTPTILQDEAFVIDCDDIEIITDSAIHSCAEDDGISMNYSLDSIERGVGGGIFMTESSRGLPITGDRIYGKMDKSNSLSRGSLSNASYAGAAVSAGGGDDKDNSSAITIVHPSIAGGDSRSSLISIDKAKARPKHERWYHILSQVGPPFLIAGLGMVGAGLLLDKVMVS